MGGFEKVARDHKAEVQLTYFENTPAIQNSTPPSKISGHRPVKTMTLKPGTSPTSVPSGSSLFLEGKNL